jgi:hypothetical protein
MVIFVGRKFEAKCCAVASCDYHRLSVVNGYGKDGGADFESTSYGDVRW